MQNEDYDMIRREMTPRAAGRALLVLMVLDRYADADGVVQMTDAQIGAEVGMEARAARAARVSLGKVSIVEVYREGRGSMSQRLKISSGDKTATRRRQDGDRIASPGAGRGDKTATRRRQDGDKTATRNDAAGDSFETWWKVYPKKTTKAKALAEWLRMKDRPAAEAVVEFIGKAKRTRRWVDGFIPDGVRFVKDRRWEDDLGAYSQSHGSGGRVDPNLLVGQGPEIEEPTTEELLAAIDRHGKDVNLLIARSAEGTPARVTLETLREELRRLYRAPDRSVWTTVQRAEEELHRLDRQALGGDACPETAKERNAERAARGIPYLSLDAPTDAEEILF